MTCRPVFVVYLFFFPKHKAQRMKTCPQILRSAMRLLPLFFPLPLPTHTPSLSCPSHGDYDSARLRSKALRGGGSCSYPPLVYYSRAGDDGDLVMWMALETTRPYRSIRRHLFLIASVFPLELGSNCRGFGRRGNRRDVIKKFSGDWWVLENR
jgi:hypothetical protein